MYDWLDRLGLTSIIRFTVGDLNDGTGNNRHFYHQNTLYQTYGWGGILGFYYREAG